MKSIIRIRNDVKQGETMHRSGALKKKERDRQTSTDSYTFGLLAKQINTKKDIQTESIKVRKFKTSTIL